MSLTTVSPAPPCVRGLPSTLLKAPNVAGEPMNPPADLPKQSEKPIRNHVTVTTPIAA